MRWAPLLSVPSAAVSFACTLASGPWDERDESVGGALESGAGILTGYTVRRDYLLDLPLRFFDYQWPEVRAVLRAAQHGGAMLWRPDATDAGTEYAVRLIAPAADVDASPEADPIFPQLWRLTLTLRRTNGTAFGLNYWAEP